MIDNIHSLCPPATIYLVFTFTQIIIDMFKGLYNTAFFKFIVMILFTFLLNILCKEGLGIISWIIVFIPFMMLSVVTAILLFVFGLDPGTGKLHYKDLTRKYKLNVSGKNISRVHRRNKGKGGRGPGGGKGEWLGGGGKGEWLGGGGKGEWLGGGGKGEWLGGGGNGEWLGGGGKGGWLGGGGKGEWRGDGKGGKGEWRGDGKGEWSGGGKGGWLGGGGKGWRGDGRERW